MPSTSSTPVSDLIQLTSSLSFKSQEANKLEHLVEYSYVPEDAQISATSQPLINPYVVYQRPRGVTTIRQLLHRRRPAPKEYVQASNLNQCLLKSTEAEQYVTIEVPQSLIKESLKEAIHISTGEQSG